MVAWFTALLSSDEWRRNQKLTHKIYINIFIITLFYYIYKHKNSKTKPKKSRKTLNTHWTQWKNYLRARKKVWWRSRRLRGFHFKVQIHRWMSELVKTCSLQASAFGCFWDQHKFCSFSRDLRQSGVQGFISESTLNIN